MRRHNDETENDEREPGAAMQPATSPEPDEESPQRRAARLRREAKAALKANPDIAANVARQSEPMAVDQSHEDDAPARLPWQGDGERLDLSQPADGPRLPDESTWPTDPKTGARISPKLYARKAQDAKEAEASERGDARPAGKVAYLNDAGSDESYDQARQRYDHAESHLRALQAEQASFTGKMQDAIASQDLDAMGTLRARQRELPDLIFAARCGAAKLKLAFMQMRAARKRVAKNEARAADAKVTEEYQEWQRKIAESRSSAQTAEYEADDAVRDVGAVQRELDALDQEALAMAVGPQAHRAPIGGMVEYAADNSALAPLGSDSGN